MIVGEFALSNLSEPGDDAHKSDWQKYADNIFYKFRDSGINFSVLWNFDCQYTSWGMKNMAQDTGIKWDLGKY